jgi:hypothetical protein
MVLLLPLRVDAARGRVQSMRFSFQEAAPFLEKFLLR